MLFQPPSLESPMAKIGSGMELSPTQPGEAHIEKDSEALHLSFSLL